MVTLKCRFFSDISEGETPPEFNLVQFSDLEKSLKETFFFVFLSEIFVTLGYVVLFEEIEGF